MAFARPGHPAALVFGFFAFSFCSWLGPAGADLGVVERAVLEPAARTVEKAEVIRPAQMINRSTLASSPLSRRLRGDDAGQAAAAASRPFCRLV
jgi:hypothetical protein